MILGLTIAEVFLLILFALLLVWMIGTRKGAEERRRSAVVVQRVAELSRSVADLQEQKKLLLASTDGNRFDDMFRELGVIRQRLEKLEKERAGLVEAARVLKELAAAAGQPNATPNEAGAALKDRLVLGEEVLKATNKKGASQNRPAEVAKLLAALADIRSSLEASGTPTHQIPQVRDALQRARDYEGRLRNAERRLQELGRGTEWPACWADSTGKPEYIFDVALNSASLVVRDNALPHRVDQQRRLPIESLKFDVDLRVPEFRSMTAQLFKWSEAEHCRFFVRVFDVTGAAEKAAYKLHLRTVGEHFYYYEELTRPWG